MQPPLQNFSVGRKLVLPEERGGSNLGPGSGRVNHMVLTGRGYVRKSVRWVYLKIELFPNHVGIPAGNTSLVFPSAELGGEPALAKT